MAGAVRLLCSHGGSLVTDGSGNLVLAVSHWIVTISAPGWNRSVSGSGDYSGYFMAMEIFDGNGNRLNNDRQTSMTFTVTANTHWTVRFKLKAWDGNEEVTPADIGWEVNAEIVGGQTDSESGNMGGTTTDNVQTGFDTTGGLPIGVWFSTANDGTIAVAEE